MVKGYIDRIEEDKAVILLGEDYKKLTFPVKYLPKDLGEGDFVTVEINRDTEQEDEEGDDLLALWESTKAN